MTEWTPTAELRFHSDRPNPRFGSVTTLVQKWVSSDGKSEWRAVPVVDEKDWTD